MNEAPTRYRGIVKSFNRLRGFGFISPVAGQGLPERDVFAHVTGVIGAGPRDLNPGDHVSFELKPGNDKGPQAWGIRVQLRAYADPAAAPRQTA